MTTLQTGERSGRAGVASLGRQFADLWSFDPFRSFSSAMSNFSGIEIARNDTGYAVEIPVPGYKPQDIDVTLEDGLLTVHGKNEKRSFTRTLTVPEEIDAERIEANVEHGMLTLALTLLPKAQPKKIEVKSR